MALSRNARTLLQRLVQRSKQLLMEDIASQLTQYYGIDPKTGQVQLVENLATKDASILYTAKLLRERLDYIHKAQASAKTPIKESIAQLIREQAFTVLNRLAALRMAEERNIIRESIRKKFASEGFEVYDQVTGQGQTTNTFTRYKWYLHAIFDELAQDLPAVFDRFSPYALMFPQENTLNEILDLINNPELANFREEGSSAKNLWKEDETIGWIYQYYNSREEIRAMRDASQAPRNSRELAVRNQFFTPRYVVQFLTDNSLGRIWYEMTKGNTTLKEQCEYMIIRPNEVFLQKGEDRPQNAEEDIHYVDFRPIKDPRELLMLDPACGSMHFGLYCFDLFEVIYREAWDNHPDLLSDLRNSMSRSEYIRQIPELIIRHNIHGVDIDPRALQIAALSLWLRAQRSFNKMQITPENRPAITKSNLVLAEPMPGNTELLNKVLEPLEKPIQELVRHIWDTMKLAGETGLLLRIEKEIDDKIAAIAKELSKETAKEAQLTTDTTADKEKTAKDAARYASKEYRQEFLQNAKTQVLDVLKQLAHQAHNGDSYQRLLFADDSARGFVFIELCSKSFDVVLMNPPFGAASEKSEKYIQANYPNWAKNILAAFFNRMMEMLNSEGLTGAIYDRTVIVKSTYEGFRRDCLCGNISAMADTGWNVLEANVETSTTVFTKKKDKGKGVFFDLRQFENKEKELISLLKTNIYDHENVFVKHSLDFNQLPNSVIGYQWHPFVISLFSNYPSLSESNLQVREGHSFVSDLHFRLYFEILDVDSYFHLFNGGGFSLFYYPYREIAKYGNDGYLISSHRSTILRNKDYQCQSGVGYGKRGDYLDSQIVKANTLFGVEGKTISGIENEEALIGLSFLNSSLAQYLINLYAGQHKQAGYVNLLPMPSVSKVNIEDILKVKRKWYSIDETSLEYTHILSLFQEQKSIRKTLKNISNEILLDKSDYEKHIQNNDMLWLNSIKVPQELEYVFSQTQRDRPIENLISIDGVTDETIDGNPNMIYEIISNMLGVVFGRWDIRSIKDPSLIPEFGDFFDPLPFMPVVALSEKPKGYPIDFPEDGILVQDEESPRSITKAIIAVVRELWSDNADNILNELAEIGQFDELGNFLKNPNGFFAFHLMRYTKSRREAPIYWPLSTTSGAYTVWVYYPKLNSQTLYKIISDHINPKEEMLEADITKMRNNPNLDNKGLKELKDMENLLHELKDFREGLLQVAQLPYKPNHDDGVLITAAPLYKFFRHSRWRNKTEECWKKLEDGEYDWSHMAYNIWPDRVRKKCVKDLSMAIAHGLEDICEIKPKEPKAKKKREPKKVTGSHTINFEE